MAEFEPTAKKLRTRYYCDHCNDSVSKSTFYRHKGLDSKDKESGSEMDGSEIELLESDAPTCTDNGTNATDNLEPAHPGADSLHALDHDFTDIENKSVTDSSDDDEDNMESTEIIPEEILIDSDEEEYPEPVSRNIIPFPVRILITFIFIWQFCFGVSDTGVSVLVIFLHNFLRLLGSLWKNENAQMLASQIPCSYKASLKILGVEDQFVQYVVCPKCDAIYEYDSCIIRQINGIETSAKCKRIAFPNHPHPSRRQPCGALLLKPVRCKGEKVKWYPHKVYCYQPLKQSLKLLVDRPGFLDKCELWRKRQVPDDVLADIYDGKIWKEFQNINGRPFLEAPHNLALSLGCDWFQPYKHLTDSVGALYLVILNLPRDERYKPENIILLGIIPGPTEPKETMNSYLSPLVEELIEFWESGVSIPSSKHAMMLVRLALLCVCCDIPAARKLCGFAGHSAVHGCSKCLKEFKSGILENKLDYSGYDKQNWKERTASEHKLYAQQYLRARTKAEQKRIVSNHGLRYTVLLLLPYFDIVRMHVIDPMHNLLLGTAKHITELWINDNKLSATHFSKIHKIISGMKTPKQVGRVPSKIASSFAGFSADQWRNWTTLFSPVALKGSLNSTDLGCWLMFVRACSILCTRSIAKNSVKDAHLYLRTFCTNFERLYTAQACTPNLHLHLHLQECVFDYGPVYGWWCFPFERYNGMLGTYNTNKRNIEPQFMRKFLHHQQALSMDLPPEFSCILSKFSAYAGSLQETMSSTETVTHLHKVATSLLYTQQDYSITGSIEKLLPPIHEKCLSHENAALLQQLYTTLYPEKQCCPLAFIYYESARASLADQIYTSQKSRSDKASVVLAKWPVTANSENCKWHVGIIQYFMKHTLSFYSTTGAIVKKPHIFAYIKWLEDHDERRNWYGQSAIVCRKSTCTWPESLYSFLPIQRIYSPCVYTDIELELDNGLTDNIFVAVPVFANYFQN